MAARVIAAPRLSHARQSSHGIRRTCTSLGSRGAQRLGRRECAVREASEHINELKQTVTRWRASVARDEARCDACFDGKTCSGAVQPPTAPRSHAKTVLLTQPESAELLRLRLSIHISINLRASLARTLWIPSNKTSFSCISAPSRCSRVPKLSHVHFKGRCPYAPCMFQISSCASNTSACPRGYIFSNVVHFSLVP